MCLDPRHKWHLQIRTNNNDGVKFPDDLLVLGQEFSPTIPELKRLLMMKLGAAHFAKIRDKVQGQQRQKNPAWDHAENPDYRNALIILSDDIKQTFPKDMAKISNCKQRGDEPVAEYYQRLHDVFK